MNVEKYRATASKLVRNPDDAMALVDQYANIAEKRDNAKFYLPIAKRAYELAPNDISPTFNYASALNNIGEFEKAKELYVRCVKLADDEWMPKVLHHIGISYRGMDENRKAIEYYQKAYDLCGDPKILKDQALAILASGDLLRGFKAFEVRREVANQKFTENEGHLVSQQKLPDGVVHWQGEVLTGKTIVVYHEEGSGDFFQFCRYIPLLKHVYGARRVFICGPVAGVLDLVSDNIAVDGVVPLSGPFDSDYVVGSMSLPWLVDIEQSKITGRPYFFAEAADIPRRGRLNVGLVWRGNLI